MSHAVSLCPPQIIIHRHHSTHRLISRHCPEDSGVSFCYTPQTSPLSATKCITQRDYQIRHCLIALALCFAHIAKHLRFLHCAKIVVTECLGSDRLVLPNKHVVDFIETCTHILNILVEFKFLFGTSGSYVSLLVPLFGTDTSSVSP